MWSTFNAVFKFSSLLRNYLLKNILNHFVVTLLRVSEFVEPQPCQNCCVFMSPVSPVLYTVVTVNIGLKNLFRVGTSSK